MVRHSCSPRPPKADQGDPDIMMMSTGRLADRTKSTSWPISASAEFFDLVLGEAIAAAIVRLDDAEAEIVAVLGDLSLHGTLLVRCAAGRRRLL